MQSGLLRLPAGFVALTAVLLGTAGVAMQFPHTAVPALQLFLPSMYLTTLLFELATHVLLAIVFSKTRDPSLMILSLMFLACGLLDIASFLIIPLPGQPGALLFPGNTSAPYVFVTWHAVLPIGAIWYAFERPRRTELAPSSVRAIMDIGIPLAFLFFVVAIVGIVALTLRSVPLSTGVDLTAYRHSLIAYADVPITLIALVALIRLIAQGTRSTIDLAVFLALTYSFMIVIISLSPTERFTVPWFTGRSLYFVSSTFVLIAAIRDLIDRMSRSVRFEADEMRVAATAYRENAAVEASLMKSRFVAMVSHELRTPLSGIIGMVELLGRTPLTERQRTWTAAIRTSADSLLRIVNDLLDFSRVESGIVEFEDTPFEVSQLVDDVALLFREAARERGVAIHAFVDPALPATITGDQTRIKQVLQNLVANAVRFTNEGSIRIEVAPEWMADGTLMVRFTVHDTGIGIGRAAQERIFNAFTQEDASTARRFGGTGLGLAIARHLVQLMGGRITVRSVIGVGSTFAFTIPYRSTSTDADLSMPLRNVRAVVVESDAEIRSLLERYVRGWEMASDVYASTADARAAADARGPGECRCDVLLVGPSIAPVEATGFVRDLRGGSMLGGAAAIFIRGEHAPEESCPPGFDAAIAGPMRQSSIFNTIVKLRRHEFIEDIVPAIDGIAPRRPRSERILVAEDNDVNQALLVAQLEHLGFQADVVTDGAAAVEAAVTRPYDLIFMDCQMPVVDGFEAARRIRTSSRAARMPIVAVTANVMPGYRDVCIAAGMDDFVAKPALIGPLARVIDRWLPTSPTAERTSVKPPSVAHDAGLDRDVRRRLREIFHGDEARVEATLALALTSLRDGARTLGNSLEARDVEGAKQTAHKLKGVAVEVGFVSVSDHLRALERELRDGNWPAAAAAHARVLTEIDPATKTAAESLR